MSVYYKKHDEVDKYFTEKIYLAVPFDSSGTNTDLNESKIFLAFKDRDCTVSVTEDDLKSCAVNGFSVEVAKIFDVHQWSEYIDSLPDSEMDNISENEVIDIVLSTYANGFVNPDELNEEHRDIKSMFEFMTSPYAMAEFEHLIPTSCRFVNEKYIRDPDEFRRLFSKLGALSELTFAIPRMVMAEGGLGKTGTPEFYTIIPASGVLWLKMGTK